MLIQNKGKQSDVLSKSSADLAIKGDESLQGAAFKKNGGEKENNSSSAQKGVKKVEKKHEGSNVYTNPLANPHRNPNVDPKRTEPLTEMEIGAIKEILKRLKEP